MEREMAMVEMVQGSGGSLSAVDVQRLIARARSDGEPFLEALWRVVEAPVPPEIRALALQALAECDCPVAP